MFELDQTTNSDNALLAAPKCVLLNSRQSKRPCRRDAWVAGTAKAVESLVGQGFTFITSVGLNTWELVIHLVNTSGGRQIIILPSGTESESRQSSDSVITDFQLDRTRCAFCTLPAKSRAGLRDKSFWKERDLRAVGLADVIVPISLRNGGSLEQLVAASLETGKQVIDDFRTDYRAADDQVRYRLRNAIINPVFHQDNWNYLTHWTRSSHSPYPTETHAACYHDILMSDSYPRSAFNTLARIVTDRTILSSPRFIRGGYSTVSFTALNPIEAIGLMRWRRRYVYYSFEPYGVAIDTDFARAVGLRPVIYGDDDLFEQLRDDEKPFYQKSGSAVADWLPEAEWRHVGDLSLTQFPNDKVHLITYTESEAASLRQMTEYEVIPLTLSR
jgi:hypothetical protein